MMVRDRRGCRKSLGGWGCDVSQPAVGKHRFLRQLQVVNPKMDASYATLSCCSPFSNNLKVCGVINHPPHSPTRRELQECLQKLFLQCWLQHDLWFSALLLPQHSLNAKGKHSEGDPISMSWLLCTEVFYFPPLARSWTTGKAKENLQNENGWAPGAALPPAQNGSFCLSPITKSVSRNLLR